MRIAGLKLFGRFDRYVGLLFTSSYGVAALLVVGLSVLMDLAGNLDFFEVPEGEDGAPLLAIAKYYLLSAPFLFLQVAPFVTVIAGLFTGSKLVKHSEVVALLNAGISAQRVFLPVFFGASLAALGMFGLREWATNSFSETREQLYDQLEEKRSAPIHESVWLRTDSGELVHVEAFYPNEQTATGVRVVQVRDGIWSEQFAERANWVPAENASSSSTADSRPQGHWSLTAGRQWRNAEEDTQQPLERFDGQIFTPQDLRLAWRGAERPLELSFTEVVSLISRDPDNRQLQTLLQNQLTFPLANLVLLLVALPFILRFNRSRGPEGLAAGVILCVFYFSADFVCRSLGMEGGLSPMVSSWLPVLAFGSLGAVLYDGMAS